MASKKKAGTVFEGMVLTFVIVFPLLGLLWYVINQNAPAPAPQAPAVTVPVSTAQQPAVAAPASATITLDDESALPSVVTTGEIVPFSFTIDNTGAGEAAYSYKVYVNWKSGEHDVIDENSVSIAAGASQSIAESLKFESTSASGEVFIQIAEPSESIHFNLPT